MAYIYRHIRLDKNEPFYIGIGSDDKFKRAYSKYSRNPHWHNIAKSNYEVEILLDNLTWEEACEKEKEFIKLYGRKDLGKGTLVNMTDGGEGLINASPEIIKKRSEIHMNNKWRLGKKHSDESKNKMSESHKGKKLTEKTKDKISLSSKGKNKSERSFEHKEKLGKVHRGKTINDDHRQKISNSMKGKNKSIDFSIKMSESMKNMQKIKCPHCDKIGNKALMTRYHFQNCKHI